MTEPFIHPDAHLADTNFAGDPAASCPQQATAGIPIESKELVYP